MANAQAHCFGNVHKVKIFITIKQRLFNKGLRRTENFEVVCSLQQVSLSEYINNDIWGGGTLEYLKIVAYLFFCLCKFLLDAPEVLLVTHFLQQR